LYLYSSSIGVWGLAKSFENSQKSLKLRKVVKFNKNGEKVVKFAKFVICTQNTFLQRKTVKLPEFRGNGKERGFKVILEL
jgi:hypothetical protein